MRQTKRKIHDRVLAIILSLMMIVAIMPLNALAEKNAASVLTTDIEEKVFYVGTAAEFTFTTTANDDANTMVRGSFSFSDPDAIEKLEYLESKDGNWYEFNGDFGPETGFPMIDGTSTFRATFNKAGNYTVTASMKTVDNDTELCSVEADVVVKSKVTITATSNDGGTISLNNDNSGSLVVDAGTSVAIGIKANDGYQIASLNIGGIPTSNVAGKTEFSVNTVVAGDITVEVVFVKVWTVTVTHTENGVVEVTPAGEGGSVTVETGTKVSIKAMPEKYYHVSKVIINGVVDTSFTSANDAGYETELTADKEYTVEITFAPNIYSIEVEDSVNGTAASDSTAVEYNGNSRITITPDAEYTVDAVTVVDAATNNPIPFSDITKENGIVYFDIKNIATDVKVNVIFKKAEKAAKTDLTVNSDAALRANDDKTLLVIKDGSDIIFSTDKNGIRIYDNEGVYDGDEATQSVLIGTTMPVTKVELYYQADGEYYADWHTVDMDAINIVVDKGENVTASLTANPAANENGYHNANVILEVSAEDTGDYSGLALVEYWITYNGVEGTRTVLYEYKDGEEIRNPYVDSEKLVVDASLYNSKDIKVTLRAVDRAGNEKTVEKTLKINATRPTVSLDITGTHFENAQEGYYNDARELTITIVDREDTFSAANVASGLKVKKNGAEITVDPSDITWTHADSLHIGKYIFAEDGHYEWELSYTNIAGLGNDGVVAPGDKDIYDFYVDKAAPHNLKVTYEPDFVDVVLETITFGFYKAPVTVMIEATDDTAGIEQFEYSYTVDADASSVNVGKGKTIIESDNITRDGGRAYATFTIAAQFRGKVAFSATDRAGRTAKLSEEKTIVVDTVAPGITVEYDNNDAYNGKYYKADRTATIEITEANFFADDIKDGLLVITRSKVLNDGTRTEETLTPEFTKDGDVYTAQVLFDENADYTFDIRYTDRSGNVYDSYPMDEFTIDKIPPVIAVSYSNNTCINENQFNAPRTATITVTEHNFIESDIIAKVNNAEYTMNWAPVDGVADTYRATVVFPGDAHYTFEVNGVDCANNGNVDVDTGDSVAPWEFTVDSSGPEADSLKVTYETKFIDTLLEGITFGFYKAPVTVRIEAADSVSGIDYFTYSYTVQNGTSSVNVGKRDVKIDATEGTDAAYARFEIPAQFRGCVSFVATNNAGVTASYAEEKVVVVDTIAPGITVEYDNNNAANDNYYRADRTATIKITEANFFADDIKDGLLVITRTKVLNDGTSTEETLAPEFTKDGDVYTATVLFDENADYIFDIKYTDRSGNVYDSYEMDKFTIDKVAPEIFIEMANGAYYNANRTAKITVVEHNFRASDFDFSAEAHDVTGKKVDLSDYTAYLKEAANWTKVAADTWEATIIFDTEGNYTLNASYADLAENPQKNAIADTFCVDKSNPQNLKVTYTPGFVGVLLEKITFGFYKAPVTVTIEATDDYAGVDHFVYSYLVEAGASATNTGKSNIEVAAENDGETSRYYATFEIPAQFRGNVSFTAYDKATNTSSFVDENVVIVDNIAPGVNVSYDNYNALYDNYYRADRTATIEITEANFFGTAEWGYADLEEEFLVITVGKTLNDGTYTSTKMKPEFSKNGDIYTATILFDENADYTFDTKYTDRSGNVYDSYEMDKFTIDKIKPVIRVSYDDDEAKYENNDQFRTNRTATIVITEHNFNAADVVAKVMASGTEVKNYAEYLADDANWTHNGDVHTAVIQYTEEAHYTFEISYTDMAGNANEPVNYGDSVAPTAFTIDKTAPTEMDIKIAGESVKGSMETLVFDKFYDAAVTVKLSANFDISGIQSMTYQKVANVSEYDENGTWIDYYSADDGIVVSPSEKFIIYFRAEDRAGNVDIIRSTGIVADDKKPVGETNAPNIDILPAAPNVNGIHNGDVLVEMKVVDPKYSGAEPSANGYYSGLKKITYKVYTTDTEEKEEGTLFNLTGVTTGAVFDGDNLVSSWSGKITIDAAKFNSNNVIVEVTATDNAGNPRTNTTAAGDIKIDITAPKIEVSYNNNDADSASYFKADRTATIVVTERNFKAEDVAINLTNSEGVIPALSNWAKTEGSGNMDNTKWSATLTYSTDGDYEFSMECVDLAGWKCDKNAVNYGTSVAPTKFTIDKTIPTVEVSYDNNSALNTNYYKEGRVATIVITEHNLEPNGTDKDRVAITMTATDDGAATTVPAVSAWRTEGDKHTATINYSGDALYTFDIAIKDKAGNESADFAEQTFYVDKTAPTLEITGVADNSANNGDVIPVITYSDTNYDASQVTITLTGANRRSVELDGAYADIHNGRTFTFKNFAKEKKIDDIYTLTATLTDKAGNTTTETITFSVNRFGSTYALSDDTKELNGTYVKEPVDVVITETNANELSNIKITLFKDGETIVLTEGSDYKIEVEGGSGQWYRYTYTIFAKNFEADGVYSLAIESDDAAGNEAKNDQDTKDTAISFGVDSTLPIINIENLESKTTYAVDNMTVKMSVKDNLKLTKIIVELDGKEFRMWTGEELDEIIKNGGNFTFDIAGDSTSAHKLVVYAVDAAGNGEKISETELPANAEAVEEFYVTTNLWVRYYTNKPLFFGSIAGVILVAGLIVFLVAYKKKKSEDNQ